MRRIVSVGIGPSPDLLTLRATRVLREAPVILTYFGDDVPYPLEEIADINPRARLMRLGAAFAEGSSAIEENIRMLRSSPEDWGAFLEIGDSTLRNPLVHHVLGGAREFDLEFVPGVSSASAALSRLGITTKHYCVAGGEECGLLDHLSSGPCDLIVLINIGRGDGCPFDLLRSRGYSIKFIRHCCGEGEEILDHHPGDTYWVVAVARR
ncbi:MAG: SAM-dependent methyltransferase [Conexivisphaerales archaeon]|nr:SAM-dependent methyltransferase [Conexivisphaerales archaeon]